MTMRAFVNGRVLIDGAFAEGRAVLVADGRIAAIVAARDVPADAAREDLDGAILAPGFVDTQVNGGGGVLFNDAPTVEGIAAIGAAHRRYGTTAFLPTLISDELPVIARAIAAVDAAIAVGVPGVLGIHVEGPFLNTERRGIHRADRMRALDEEAMAILTAPRRGRMLVTLAPERVAPGMIRRLVASGARVAVGHSNARYADVMAAREEGLTGATHLFNAMSQLGSREPGVVGAALGSDIVCGIIVDGHHVSPATLRLALRLKGPEQLMLVTDAMPNIGADLHEFLLQERRIVVREDRLVDAAGTLAGANLTMTRAVGNATALLGVSRESAIAMASATPARFLGLDGELGRIAPGLRADLVALREDHGVAATWIGGERGDR